MHTTHRYEGGLLVESVTAPVWTEHDRALVLAYLAEKAETCPSCGHPMSVCRDPRTAGRWRVIESICQPSRVRQAKAEDAVKAKRRGLLLGTQLSGGGGG